MVIIMNAMNAEKINKLKNDIINYIIPLLDDLRDENKKEVDNIRISFVFTKNDIYKYKTSPIELANTIKLALDEIRRYNPDIRRRVDVFDLDDAIDKTCEIPVEDKGIVWILFFDKDRDRYDHPDIDRLYAEHPEFYTGYFDDDIPVFDPPKIDKFDFKSYLGYCYYLNGYFDSYYSSDHFALNQHTGYLFEKLAGVKESNTPFLHLVRRKSKVLDDTLMKEMLLNNSFITDAIIDRAKQEGLKCKTIKIIFDDTDYNEHFFIYKSENEKMNKSMQDLQKEAR